MMNIVLFGPPGSGKGTQSERLQEKYGLIHLSTGDICRQEIKRETEEGLLAKRLIDGGNFFPDELAYRMVEKFLDAHKGGPGFVYDGFPRGVAQVDVFQNMLETRNAQVDLVMELVVEKEELVQRLLRRGASSGRPDDSGRSVIEKRMDIYKEVTAPIAACYKSQGVYCQVDGMGSQEEIFQRICSVIDDILNK